MLKTTIIKFSVKDLLSVSEGNIINGIGDNVSKDDKTKYKIW